MPAVAGFTAALETMHHRGPDETATATEPGVVFGFQRLAVVDRNDSHQPIRYPSQGADVGRWTAVFNGEIYNFRELRAELVRDFGAVFATCGDTEVLVAAYHHWGPSALHRLRGMFAFAMWDRLTATLHAARDPFGIKPLYHLMTPAGLFLASEKKALLPFTDGACDTAALDRASLSHYLTFQYVPEPATLDLRIRRLAAGHRLEYRPGGRVQFERYFRPEFRPAASSASVQPAGVINDVQAALRDSVHRHLHADVPVGAFLSGGIDSTAIVAFAREVDPHLRAYTVGFEDCGYSEIEDAQQTADQLDMSLTPTLVTEDDVRRELPRIVWHLDDPVADPALVPLYFLARTAARDVTVVLSGEGADELFAGYRIYREPAALAGIGRLPHRVRRALRTVSAAMPDGTKGKSYLDRATTPIELRYYGNARIFDPAEKALIMRGPAAPHTDVTGPLYRDATGLDDVATMQYVDLHTWLPGDILTKADRMSMAHSLELRVPFLDRAVYLAASRLSTQLKLPQRSRVTKYALREAVRGIVPPSIVDRPKLGFPTPTRVWLRGQIGEWAAEIFHTSGAGDLIDLRYAQNLLAAHRRGEVDNSRKVWTILMLCLWYAVSLDHSIDPHPDRTNWNTPTMLIKYG